MSTIADVAALAGVSKATASRALSGRGYVSDATRERVSAAASELSYIAHSSATSLATGRTRTVGVITPTLGRWFFTELLTGIHDALLEHGYDMAVSGVAEGSPARGRLFDTALPGRRYDGIIAAGLQPRTHELERLLPLPSPLVSVGPYDGGTSSVGIDDTAAARRATEHLIDLGHSEIAFIGVASPARQTALGDSLRIAGYRASMRAAGLSERTITAAASGDMPAAYAAAVDLLGERRGRPTAIVALCDEMAIGAIIAAHRLGIAVPTELSVVGIDDHHNAEMFSLTTIRQRPREQGADAARLLLDRIENPLAAVEHIQAPSTLVVRNSSAPPR
ncbi:LacI family DNA-binding transcriptional regulator [uncultured Microbacterium sp.]|uniref:LacI family DNA-binding transcriptional regulator n=1 Tax=uncultured Microbacterium sp. TaxID=191216 RepID=UPI00262FD169|nr:LacI family DNA-binding transcriptional regulator [uncultured Microbacterium sp.]